MGFAASAKIDGLDGLLARLDGLKRSKRTAVLRKATAKGAKVVLDAAKANLRAMGLKRKDSLLLQSLGSKVVVTKKGGVYAVVGPRTGFKRTKAGKVATKLGAKFVAVGINPVRYAHLVERGRKAVVPVKAKALLMTDGDGNTFFARRAKAVAARPFLVPALERNRSKVRDVMAAEIGAGLTKLAAKGAA